MSGIGDIINYLNPFSDNFILNGVLSSLGNILNYLNPFSDNFILKGVLTSIGNILNYLNPFSDSFILKGVLTSLGNMLNYLNPFSENFFGYKLIDLLSDLLETLFVPSENSVTSLVNSVKSKFAFIDTINNTISTLEDMFNNVEELPKLEITLPENNFYNGKVTVLDLAWYSTYKSYGDTVISAFIYVFFIWRVYISLSSTIAGVGGSVHQIVDISSFSKRRG